MLQTFKDVVSTSTTYFPTESETTNLKKNVKEALKTLSETEIEKKKKYLRAGKPLNGFQKCYFTYDRSNLLKQTFINK